jgi:hypothetical protein
MIGTKGPFGVLPAFVAGAILLRNSSVMECGPWRMAGRWAKYALPGRAASAKSGLHVGSARPGPSRIHA